MEPKHEVWKMIPSFDWVISWFVNFQGECFSRVAPSKLATYSVTITHHVLPTAFLELACFTIMLLVENILQ